MFQVNKNKLIWIYDREKRRYKVTLVQRKKATHDYTRPYKAKKDHTRLQGNI